MNPHPTPITSRKPSTIAATILLALAGSLSITGCEEGAQIEALPTMDPPVSSSFLLTKSQSCDTLRASYIDDITEQILSSYHDFIQYETSSDPDPFDYGGDDYSNGPTDAYPSTPMGGNGAPPPKSEGKISTDSSGENSGGSPSYTGTNNHEKEADESDWVKTSGDYTYILQKGKLLILKTWKPNEAKIVKSFDLSDFKKSEQQAYVDPSLRASRGSQSFYFGGRYGQYKRYKGGGVETTKGFLSPPFPHNGGSETGKPSPYEFDDRYDACSGGRAECLTAKELSFDGRYLYIYASFNLRGYATQRGSNLKGIDSGTRVIVLDVKDPEEAKVNNIVDLESRFEDARTVDSGTYVIQRGDSLGDIGSWMTADRVKKISGLLYPLGTKTNVAPPQLSVSSGSRGRRLTREDYDKIKDYYGRIEAVEALRKKQARYRIHKYLEENFSAEDLQKSLPQQVTYDKDFGQALRKPLVACDQYYVSPAGRYFNAVTVSKLPTAVKQEALSTGLIADFRTVYSNGTSLYLAQSFYPDMKDWSGSNVMTAIHKFSYPSQEGRVQFKGSGALYGTLLNQYSMSERDGYLRVVTTEDGPRTSSNTPPGDQLNGVGDGSGSGVKDDAPPTENTVVNDAQGATSPQNTGRFFGPSTTLSILHENESGSLEKVSEIKGLAPGERVYSARFIGDKAYVVTFRQVDPLFSFDLADPQHPKLIGKLKIPGFSSYIHPLDANHLLTIGRDANETGRIKGLKIEIFDITDPSNVTSKDKYVIKGDQWNSASIVEHDPHSFTFDPKSGLLVIPVEKHQSSSSTSWDDFFDGFQYFSVSGGSKIKELGQLDHFRALKGPKCEDDKVRYCYERFRFGYGYDRSYRSIVMSDPKDESKSFIYTISRLGLFIQDTSDFTLPPEKVLF